MAEERTTLRTRILAARNALPAEERQRKSRLISERILALPEFANARNVFAYVSFRSEVETLPLIAQCLKKGVTVSVPLTLVQEHRLLPYAITDPAQDLAPGYCSIPEPLQTLPLVDPAAIEVVVTPGSVFDAKGGRLGYGGGYYDRFLQSAAPQALRIGLAFDLQVVAAVPQESHDQQLDYLITETRTIPLTRKRPCPKKTAVLKDPLFLEHDPGYDHVESPERLTAIYQALARPEEGEAFFYPECEPASYADLAANHTAEYLDRVAETAGKQFDVLDPDTHTSPRSYEAAVLAAGAVITGLKLVAAGQADNAAALVRPPGHHAEADRARGFCLFNNIAVGARYGLKHLGMERIFILDWDLHHGNGTQHAFYNTDQVLYCSTHQSPLYPGTGSLQETGAGKGEGYTLNVPLPGGQGDRDFARIMDELVAPVARQYRPDCLMVSAGYDTHVSDPLGGMAVTTAGFAYMTRVMVDLAAELCEGRLVLVLEGGYNLQGLAEGVLASLHEMRGEGGLSPAAFTALTQAKRPLPALEAALAVAKKYWTF